LLKMLGRHFRYAPTSMHGVALSDICET
jgi:hypothetical protein